MSDPSSDQPLIIWALGAAQAAISAILAYVFISIRQTRTDAEHVAEGVRTELLRSTASSDAKLETMRREFADRMAEGREDRNALRLDIKEIMNRLSNVATREEIALDRAASADRIINALRDRGRASPGSD